MHAKTPNDLHLPPSIGEVPLSLCLSIFCVSLKNFIPVEFLIEPEKKCPKFESFTPSITARFNNKLIEFCSKQISFLIALSKLY